MDAQSELLSHIFDLAERSYKQNIYTFTGFLSQGEQSDVLAAGRELAYVPYTFFGGCEGCERRMLRFGSEETLGYAADFPISTLKVSPLLEKFSDDLTHRDFLGALMNLGVEREVVGDIVVRGNSAYIFCEDAMAEYLAQNLTRIRHTSVKCEISKECPEEAQPVFDESEMPIASLREDALIAAVYNLSRSKCDELFHSKCIFIDGRQCEKGSTSLKEGQTFSVRGFGKFIFDGAGGQTRKGRVYVRIRKYV